jgi:hypothetical protein
MMYVQQEAATLAILGRPLADLAYGAFDWRLRADEHMGMGAARRHTRRESCFCMGL